MLTRGVGDFRCICCTAKDYNEKQYGGNELFPCVVKTAFDPRPSAPLVEKEQEDGTTVEELGEERVDTETRYVADQ